MNFGNDVHNSQNVGIEQSVDIARLHNLQTDPVQSESVSKDISNVDKDFSISEKDIGAVSGTQNISNISYGSDLDTDVSGYNEDEEKIDSTHNRNTSVSELSTGEDIQWLCKSLGNIWESDDEVKQCRVCKAWFNLAKRKHHCRVCGRIVCAGCSGQRLTVPNHTTPQRVCVSCTGSLFEKLTDAKQSNIDLNNRLRNAELALSKSKFNTEQLEVQLETLETNLRMKEHDYNKMVLENRKLANSIQHQNSVAEQMQATIAQHKLQVEALRKRITELVNDSGGGGRRNNSKRRSKDKSADLNVSKLSNVLDDKDQLRDLRVPLTIQNKSSMESDAISFNGTDMIGELTANGLGDSLDGDENSAKKCCCIVS